VERPWEGEEHFAAPLGPEAECGRKKEPRLHRKASQELIASQGLMTAVIDDQEEGLVPPPAWGSWWEEEGRYRKVERPWEGEEHFAAPLGPEEENLYKDEQPLQACPEEALVDLRETAKEKLLLALECGRLGESLNSQEVPLLPAPSDGADSQEHATADVRQKAAAQLLALNSSGQLEGLFASIGTTASAATPPARPRKIFELINHRDCTLADLAKKVTDAEALLAGKDAEGSRLEAKLFQAVVQLQHLKMDLEWCQDLSSKASVRTAELKQRKRSQQDALAGGEGTASARTERETLRP